MPQSTSTLQLLDQLPVNQVTELDGQVYVRVVDQRRGSLQPLERLLITRATSMASQWLCNFSPKPNLRLEASLQGINVIYSQESESRVVDVVIRLKKQKPDCIIRTVTPPPVAQPVPVPVTLNDGASVGSPQNKPDEQMQLPPNPRSSTEGRDKDPASRPSSNPSIDPGIKVQNYSTEY